MEADGSDQSQLDWNQVIRQPELIQQILQQASQPRPEIEHSPENESTLVAALHTGKIRGQTYLETLNSMHGRMTEPLQVHGFSVIDWKDYYLEHSRRIDKLVTLYAVRQASQADNIANGAGPSQPARAPASLAGKGMKRARFEDRDEN
ncbi:hypothetical protein K488DRAFT_81868 [Vararia minispora EC-137]|uniref:Uncharacterized protein n=1 Tax=Vararia minispora EC-137 TaxID=1314806 RepID=A0ACB8QYJ6_9AGAM|nr:hypothetical protein K488DRAFT_81868 [Vararia minispora EC-137]